MFTRLISKINKCVNNWYSIHFTNDDKKDFTPCCSEEEKDILKKCILLVQENTNFPSNDIYLGVIEYYYSSIVLEYYASKENHFYCFDFFNKEMPKAVNVRDMITVSDEPWASQVRRAIHFAAKKGGRRLRSKFYRKKSYKKIRKMRKTRKVRKTRRNMRK